MNKSMLSESRNDGRLKTINAIDDTIAKEKTDYVGCQQANIATIIINYSVRGERLC